jgi:putative ABC transport system permease protein
MKDIHLDSNLDYEFEPNGNKTLVYIFLVVALLILVVACINFMNLSTARASGRAKEVGIRKLLGAQKPSLIGQFLSESTLITILAFIMGLIIVLLLMTPFNNLIGIELNTDILKGWILVPIIIGLVVFVGVFSGSYPAFFLAAFKPVQVLKGTIVRGTRSGKLRSMLVVLQLGVSVFILVGTFITFGQMRFLLNKDPGFDKENVLVIRRSDVLREQIETFKQELRKNPNILNAANSNSIPGRNFSNNATWTEEKGASETYLSWHSWVTAEYAETFSLEMAEGRFFSKEYPTDSFAVVINEAAINMLGLDEPVLEQNLLRPSGPQTFEPVPIIGVVKDFHFQSLHESIQPMCLFMIPGNWEGYIPVKITSDIPGTVQYIKQTWESFTTEYPFDYFWMEDDYERLYQTETRTSDIFVAFAIISLLVACLGLIGLISFTAVQRTKEIGIRKAMGSNSNSVVLLFAREISILIMASTLLASPIWFAIKAWLQKFAFHISFNLIIFIGVLLAAGLITLILSWISVGGIAINASRKNPADSLRYE